MSELNSPPPPLFPDRENKRRAIRLAEANKRATLREWYEQNFGPRVSTQTNAQSWAPKGMFTVKY